MNSLSFHYFNNYKYIIALIKLFRDLSNVVIFYFRSDFLLPI